MRIRIGENVLDSTNGQSGTDDLSSERKLPVIPISIRKDYWRTIQNPPDSIDHTDGVFRQNSHRASH